MHLNKYVFRLFLYLIKYVLVNFGRDVLLALYNIKETR